MTTALIPIPQTDQRRSPRALVCASAVIMTEGKPATEQLVYDLSTEGVRLCGLPRAAVGDKVRVRLQLPQESIGARGRVVRIASSVNQFEFAIDFYDLSASAEDNIHDAVVDALGHPDRRSLLLLRWKLHRPACFDWLDPVSPLCVTATTPLQAVQDLEEQRFNIGIFGCGDCGTQDTEWIGMYPEVCWRSIDRAGCLHPI